MHQRVSSNDDDRNSSRRDLDIMIGVWSRGIHIKTGEQRDRAQQSKPNQSFQDRPQLKREKKQLAFVGWLIAYSRTNTQSYSQLFNFNGMAIFTVQIPYTLTKERDNTLNFEIWR